MLTSSSIVPRDNSSTGPTSLAEILFQGTTGYVAKVIPYAGSAVRCNECARTALNVLGDALIVTHRHGNQWHKTIVNIEDLGLKRID